MAKIFGVYTSEIERILNKIYADSELDPKTTTRIETEFETEL